jgi:trigger factor
LAGKKAVFDVTVLEASLRTLPKVTDEFAEQVRAGLTAKSLEEELRKAIDEEDSKAFVGPRNAALATALADVLDVQVPDTLVTQQAREKFAVMMTEMRDNGVPDEEIKKQIKPENFLKYKGIVKEDIVKDFKVSMATDEIARLEGIEVDDYQVEEQLQAIKKDAGDEFDETMIRPKVEATIQRQLVMDFLAKNANLVVEYEEEGEKQFDEELLNKLAEESLERERELAKKAAAAEEGKTLAPIAQVVEAQVEEAKEEALRKDDPNASLQDKAFKALMDSGMVEVSPDPDSPDYDSSRDNEFVS